MLFDIYCIISLNFINNNTVNCSFCRPKPENYDSQGNPILTGQNQPNQPYVASARQQQNQRYAWGRVFDPWILDNITADIQNGIIGASGFQADYALIVTWERMGYGGAPKVTDLNRYEEARRWVSDKINFVFVKR